jgi:hypothetical protein
LIYIPQSMRAFIDELDRQDDPFTPPGYYEEIQDQRTKDINAAKAGSKREYVYVDPHLLSTPVIVDIDQDGHDDIVFAVTYFFDE